MELGELEQAAQAAGYSQQTYRRAKEDLVKAEKSVGTWSTGYGANEQWRISLIDRQKQIHGQVKEKMA